MNGEGLFKDGKRKRKPDAELADGICKTKKALIGSVPKGKAFDSTAIIMTMRRRHP